MEENVSGLGMFSKVQALSTANKVRVVYLHVTRACNLNCTYCYFNAGKPMESELSFAELSDLFRDIVLIAPRRLVFTGGEALLRKDLVDLAHAFRTKDPQHQISLCLMSNGLLIYDDTAGNIAHVFDEVRISIDGPREVNDRIRGEGSFDAAIGAIHCLRNAGMCPGVTITVTGENIGHLESFLSFLLEKEYVTDFHLAPFKPVGRGSGRADLICSWGDIQLAVAKFWHRNFGTPLNLERTEAHSLSCRNCGVGSNLNIHPDGTVYPCHVLSVSPFLLGNVRKTRLSKICRSSPVLKRLRDVNLSEEAAANPRIRKLLDNANCLGEVYRDAPTELIGLLHRASHDVN